MSDDTSQPVLDDRKGWTRVEDDLPVSNEHYKRHVVIFTEDHDFGGEQFFCVTAEAFHAHIDDQPEVCQVATHWIYADELAATVFLPTHGPQTAPQPVTTDSVVLDVRKLVAIGVKERDAFAWLAIRQTKGRSHLTDLAFQMLCHEAVKAGITVAEAVRVAVNRSWAIFISSRVEVAK